VTLAGAGGETDAATAGSWADGEAEAEAATAGTGRVEMRRLDGRTSASVERRMRR
jgi:hypothetical protein